MLIWRLNSSKVTGQFQQIKVDETPNKGAIAFFKGEISRANLRKLFQSESVALIMEETSSWRSNWNDIAKEKISFSGFSKNAVTPSKALVIVSSHVIEDLSKLADGTKIEISGKLEKPKIRQTWNSVGMIKGSDAKLSKQVILLSAHMDHVGVREKACDGDKIFNGADDDASGCVAVLELARTFATGKIPKRTVYFAFFGSEESGGYGSRYFVNNMSFTKENLVANLQFEMLGRPDAKVGKDELWLTGFERSNLGIELAKHGAKLVKDPRPAQIVFAVRIIII